MVPDGELALQQRNVYSKNLTSYQLVLKHFLLEKPHHMSWESRRICVQSLFRENALNLFQTSSPKDGLNQLIELIFSLEVIFYLYDKMLGK